MSDEEFELLDELYFVQSYSYLKGATGWEDEKLLITLQLLHRKDWIKCLLHPDQEIFDKVDIWASGKQYYYLASKEGLMQHNTL